MTHEEVQTLLAAVPWKRLDDATRTSAEEHIACCTACQEELSFECELEAGLEPLRSRRERPYEWSRQVRRPGSSRTRAATVQRSSRRLPAARKWTSQIPALAASFLVTGAGLALAWYAWTLRQDPLPTSEVSNKEPHRTEPGVAQAEPFDPGLAWTPIKPDPLVSSSENQAAPEAAPVLQPVPSEVARAEVAPKGAEAVQPHVPIHGAARLRPIAAGSPWSGRDSLRLQDGAIGLDLFESDLRVVKLTTVPAGGSSEVLAVSLGGGKNPARLTDLGKAGQLPAQLLETDALPVEAGHLFLLRLEQNSQAAHYLVKVSAHQPGAFVDLEWDSVDSEQAKDLLAKATPQPRPAASKIAKGEEMPPPEIRATPEKRKKKH